MLLSFGAFLPFWFSELTIIYEIANALMPFINHNEDVIFSNC